MKRKNDVIRTIRYDISSLRNMTPEQLLTSTLRKILTLLMENSGSIIAPAPKSLVKEFD